LFNKQIYYTHATDVATYPYCQSDMSESSTTDSPI